MFLYSHLIYTVKESSCVRRSGVLTKNTYTEDEFKKVLKTLFSEKKRVRELQKKLGEKGVHKKFQSKLTDIHKASIDEEFATLENAYVEKERECADLRGKMEKVRPALRKLVDDLKAARSEIEMLKKEKPANDAALKGNLEDANERVAALEKEIARLTSVEDEAITIRGQLLELGEKLDSLEEEKKGFDASLDALNKGLEEKDAELERAKGNEQKEVHRFEAERSRLVERLAEVLSQVQLQAEIIKDLRDEMSALHRECEGDEDKLKRYEDQIVELKDQQKELVQATTENTALKQQLEKIEDEINRERQSFSLHAQEWEERGKHLYDVTAQLEKAEAQLQESDLGAVREEYETKLLENEKQAQQLLDEMTAAHDAALQQKSKDGESIIAHLNDQIAEARAERDQAKGGYTTLTEQFHQTLEEKERVLEGSYSKMRELSSRHAEMVEEMEKLSQKLEEKQEHFSRLEKELASALNGMQNAKLRCEERDAEIRRAQQHLAKKSERDDDFARSCGAASGSDC